VIVDAGIALGCAVLGAAVGYPMGRRLANARAFAIGLMVGALVLAAAGVGLALFAGERRLAMIVLGSGFGVLEGVRLASGGVFAALAEGKRLSAKKDADG
jgi:hypothetical protein